MAEPLTKLESSVYHYLLDFTAERTYQPSIRDIGKQFKIKSTKTVSDLLQSLAKKGWVSAAHCGRSLFPTTERSTLASRR